MTQGANHRTGPPRTLGAAIRPYGMPTHAEDLASVLAALTTGPVVVGHSMGAFAAPVLADLFPEGVRSLVLVDGRLPLQVPAGISDEEVVSAVLGPAAERLNCTFPAARSTGPSGGSTLPSAPTGPRWWRSTWTTT